MGFKSFCSDVWFVVKGLYKAWEACTDEERERETRREEEKREAALQQEREERAEWEALSLDDKWTELRRLQKRVDDQADCIYDLQRECEDISRNALDAEDQLESLQDRLRSSIVIRC